MDLFLLKNTFEDELGRIQTLLQTHVMKQVAKTN
jgi:hypothetical protein